MLAEGAKHSKAFFRMNQAAGIANAVVSTAQGVAKALEWGYPLGPVFGAIIAANGAAQIATIAGASFDGGGKSVKSGGGGGGGRSAPSSQLGAVTNSAMSEKETVTPRNIYINIDDKKQYSGSAVRDAIKAITEQAGDRVRFTA
jgi:hypothetical protein